MSPSPARSHSSVSPRARSSAPCLSSTASSSPTTPAARTRSAAGHSSTARDSRARDLRDLERVDARGLQPRHYARAEAVQQTLEARIDRHSSTKARTRPIVVPSRAGLNPSAQRQILGRAHGSPTTMQVERISTTPDRPTSPRIHARHSRGRCALHEIKCLTVYEWHPKIWILIGAALFEEPYLQELLCPERRLFRGSLP